jgi:rfaE bifunctional protein nucleotidyltransferase chain/domain
VNKIISYNKINSLSIDRKKRLVLVGGCFDLFHFGHLQFLKRAKKAGDFLIVALESDEFIKKKKKRYPFHEQKERAEILASLSMVDLVVLLPYFSSKIYYEQLVKKLKPDILAVSQGDPQFENKKEQIKKVGGKIRIVNSIIKKFSSSNIIERLKNLKK